MTFKNVKYKQLAKVSKDNPEKSQYFTCNKTVIWSGRGKPLSLKPSPHSTQSSTSIRLSVSPPKTAKEVAPERVRIQASLSFFYSTLMDNVREEQSAIVPVIFVRGQ